MESRSIKQLLQILLDNKHLFNINLLLLVNSVFYCDIITPYEKWRLENYIYHHLPYKVEYTFNGIRCSFPPLEWKPREKWMKGIIKSWKKQKKVKIKTS